MSLNSISMTTVIPANATYLNQVGEDEILGSTFMWVYLAIGVLQGIIAMAGNLKTIIVVCRYEFLWENSTSRMHHWSGAS